MSVIVPFVGKMRVLDRALPPGEQVTPDEAKDPHRLARAFTNVLRDVALLRRRWSPRRVDFEDWPVDATGTTKYRFEHKFDGRVRWWPVDWSGSVAPILLKHTDTTANTLVLTSKAAGTVTIRVEESG
jgi:hypothetical protein